MNIVMPAKVGIHPAPVMPVKVGIHGRSWNVPPKEPTSMGPRVRGDDV